MARIDDRDYSAIYLALGVMVVGLLFILFGLKKNKEDKNGKSNPVALDSENYQAFPLIDVKVISHDVKRFRFGLPSPTHRLGLPIGQHISLKYVDENGEEVIRSYTPTSSDDDLGYVDFVVKVYFKNVHPKFPDGGKMSQHLNDLKIGDTILMRGPKGHLEYFGEGKFTIKKLGQKEATAYHKKRIGMIAGGTGITPMLQIINAIKKNPADDTELWLIFANQTEEDILLRKELEELVSDRFHLHYTLDRPPADWKYSSGFINTDMCRNHLPSPGPDSMVFVCGPPPMIKFACEPAFKEIGMTNADWFSF
mmetsp:Transcript_26768/g.20052  ORF Transcript_26768/g.20052 Transcript_26768/m.20052 type:complete len:309 (+) Transcript_26768:10-936(+)